MSTLAKEATSDFDDIAALLGKAVLGIGGMVASVLISGWVLSILWGWFIVPTFHLPQLALLSAIGVSLVVRFLTVHPVDVEPPERTSGQKWARFFVLALAPLISLAFGWLIHLFWGMA